MRLIVTPVEHVRQILKPRIPSHLLLPCGKMKVACSGYHSSNKKTLKLYHKFLVVYGRNVFVIKSHENAK